MSTPQAIFMAGPAGAGKSFVSKSLPLSKFKVINIDDSYEELLKAAGIGTKIKDFTPDELSQAAKLMAVAQKTTKEKYTKAIAKLEDIIVDGTGAASKPLLKKMAELEALGYETMMIMIYVSPLVSLERNSQRERSLLPSIVLRTWRDINSNIETYEQAFGDNLVIINNDPEDADKSFTPEEIFKLYPQPKGKEKSPEEAAKSKLEKEKLNQDIKSLLDIEREFDTFDEAKQKINKFINS